MPVEVCHFDGEDDDEPAHQDPIENLVPNKPAGFKIVSAIELATFSGAAAGSFRFTWNIYQSELHPYEQDVRHIQQVQAGIDHDNDLLARTHTLSPADRPQVEAFLNKDKALRKGEIRTTNDHMAPQPDIYVQMGELLGLPLLAGITMAGLSNIVRRCIYQRRHRAVLLAQKQHIDQAVFRLGEELDNADGVPLDWR